VAGPPPSGTDFPYGSTAVTCLATDGAGLKSKPVAFSVVVGCGSGYSFRDGACKSECGNGAAAGQRGGARFGVAAIPPPAPTSSMPHALPPLPRPPDNDECVLGGGAKCHPDAECTDSQGTYSCACKKGYEDISANRDGTNCTGEFSPGSSRFWGVAQLARAPLTFDLLGLHPIGSTPENPEAASGPSKEFSKPCHGRRPLSNPADIDECTLGTHDCHRNATCTNMPGGFTCACNAAQGYSGNGTDCVDSERPTLTADAALVSAKAAPNVTYAPVKFPALTAADNVSPPEKIIIACTANSAQVKGAGEADATNFTVGTTIVTCVAMDEAGHYSHQVTFAAVVTCADDYALKAGACTGERSVFLFAHNLAPLKGAGSENQTKMHCTALGLRPSHHHAPLIPPYPAPSICLLVADAVAPKLELKGKTPVLAKAPGNGRLAKVAAADWPTLTPTDAVAPAGAPAAVVSCRASLDGGPAGPVTPAGTDFPYGVTVVTCTAADAAGNVSPAVSFAVEVACDSGYSVRTEGGLCQSEF
jgi:hypothetical protein